jgi:hypothetical protein
MTKCIACLALALLAILVVAGACGSSRSAPERPRTAHEARGAHPGPPAVIRGTTVDASTGAPLGGVRVEGPGGAMTRSDPAGRFELRGVETGIAGELVGRTDDGRSGRNRLRPLTGGVLEVVLVVR